MRRTVLGILTAAALALVALAGPASADDPALYVDDNNGRVVKHVEHPDFPSCAAEVAVDLHRGYSSSTDPTANFVSGVARVTRQGAIRAQVDNIRVGSTGAGQDVNDVFPSGASTARINTGAYVSGGGVTTLYKNDTDPPADVDPPFEPPFVSDGLNSDFDFVGNVNPLRAYGDWLNPADVDPITAGAQALDPVVQVRSYGTMRCSNGALFRWTVLSYSTLTDA